MIEKSIVQQMLGENWDNLPQVLKDHHQYGAAVEVGSLGIKYPKFMQPILTGLRFMGILINHQAETTNTIVNKCYVNKELHWQRIIKFDDKQEIKFNSKWVYVGSGEIIEYVNSFIGLKMCAKVDNKKLIFEGKCYIFNFGLFSLSVPEWLLLGHTIIKEKQVDAESYMMDFRLIHPLLGEVYRYSGKFKTNLKERVVK